MKSSKLMFVVFLGPALLSYLIIYVYPVLRTALMSFFYVQNITDNSSEWKFVKLDNYINLLTDNQLFMQSLKNIGYIYFWGLLGVMFFALLFAVILNSGVRFKEFFRSVLYLPNIVAAVAMGTMWVQYVFNSQYGLLRSIFNFFGLTGLAEFAWTDDTHLLLSMTIAYSFGCIGYFMLIYMAAMDKVPSDYYEAATIEGAGIFNKFFRITLPLIRNVFRTTLVLWSTGCIGFFAWSLMFSNINWNIRTVTPMVYMYNIVFQDAIGMDPSQKNAGAGAAVGMILTILAVAVFTIINFVVKEDDVEY
ncbi:carbohydrate ABC transporter permease [Cohnella silvisoli]|uniref:Sugar ABC transporter permease n=1 Tax=Cohnella silvisoli TaxID=2873699 RepID=A0ABV1KY08_9BACL|nr:sugar ABC transporter permease [Cohnella silvisoli]MCD9021867.1 sugar ABC transporter permease [Cohnella silvisoli]